MISIRYWPSNHRYITRKLKSDVGNRAKNVKSSKKYVLDDKIKKWRNLPLIPLYTLKTTILFIFKLYRAHLNSRGFSFFKCNTSRNVKWYLIFKKCSKNLT